MSAPRTPPLIGRAEEREQLDRAVDRVRHGESAVFVVRGEAGIGKTALLTYCGVRASGFRVFRISGVESELEMPFAALHQLCTPLLAGLPVLPAPQQHALRVAFGLAEGHPPDRFVVGLAVLGLLAEAAGEPPVAVFVDDAQWLDEASTQVLGFVGRRLLAEAVLLVLAVREEGEPRLFPTLPPLSLVGLPRADARALLAAAIPGPLHDQVRDRIIAETRGNPLGLLELPVRMDPAELAGGFAVPATDSLPGHIQAHYEGVVRSLPEPTQRLMLLAAADPTGDAVVVWRAAQSLGVGREAADVARAERLLEIGSRVRFHHPLVRSATYAAATAQDRCTAHLALADAIDAQRDPERRVWHRAAAALAPDEDVAAELEQAADAAMARAGLAGAAAFLQRAAVLTADPARRAERALAAAFANMQSGAFEAAGRLLSDAASVAVTDLQRARVEQRRGQIAWASSPGREAPALLVQAARRLEALDVSLARQTYLDAWIAALVAGPLAEPGSHLLDVCRAARSVLPAAAAGPADVLLDAVTTLTLDGPALAGPIVRRAIQAFLGGEATGEDWLRWGGIVTGAAAGIWEFDSWIALSRKHVDITRAIPGALVPAAFALTAHIMTATLCGELDEANVLVAKLRTIQDVTGIHMVTNGDGLLAAHRGRSAEASALFAATLRDSTARGEGFGLQLTSWAEAILELGQGHYVEALAAAERAVAGEWQSFYTPRVLPEVIEAAARTGDAATARGALGRLTAVTQYTDADWAVGITARARALLSEGQAAEQDYLTAIERLGRTGLRLDLARAHLLYGEWLRRAGRRLDARHQLRIAHDTFIELGTEAFAERARRELLATGEKVRRQQEESPTGLTPQEDHIARLAREGRTNTEIGAELFLSSRTVEWHLRKVFAKLGISSRRDLQAALPASIRFAASSSDGSSN